MYVFFGNNFKNLELKGIFDAKTIFLISILNQCTDQIILYGEPYEEDQYLIWIISLCQRKQLLVFYYADILGKGFYSIKAYTRIHQQPYIYHIKIL